MSEELRRNVSPFSPAWARVRDCEHMPFQSRSTTGVMISTVISLICENSTAVLTPAKKQLPLFQYSFTPGVYGTASCCDGVRLGQPAFSPKQTMFHNNLVILKKLDGYIMSRISSLIVGTIISEAGSG